MLITQILIILKVNHDIKVTEIFKIHAFIESKNSFALHDGRKEGRKDGSISYSFCNLPIIAPIQL